MSEGVKRIICLALFTTILILTILCLSLALAKVKLFDQTNGILKYNKGIDMHKN
ncbi:5259_t:CDS:2 [Dentiscutata erythropus]|uniref:5259_t:CDS:1 n=1 Tax=Dentiscutata erythropus TaxID=1348616 RepID=A0A9N9AU73_9GLOM|nr:5259_t:CDS:2 [Dentiscutata erythropus]